MAPSLKRPAASSGPSKRPRGAFGEKCSVVAAALAEAPLPKDVLKMLASCVPHCLCGDRAAQQEEAVAWIGQALDALEKQLLEQQTALEAQLESQRSELAAKDAAVAEQEAAAQRLCEEEAAARGRAQEAEAAVSTAGEVLAAAKRALEAGEKEQAARTTKREELQAALASMAELGTKKAIDGFVKLLKREKFDAALLQSAPMVLQKQAAERADFDKMVLKTIEGDLQGKLTELSSSIDGFQQAAEEQAAAVAAAEKAASEAQEALTAATAAAASAAAEVKRGQSAVKEAKRHRKEAGPAVKDAEAAAKEAQQKVRRLKDGALATFAELRDGKPEAAPMEPEPAEPEPAEPAAETRP